MAAKVKNAPTAVVGLDVGSGTIKVTEARFTKEGIVITGLGMAKTPEGVIEDEVVVDPKALGAAIKQLLADVGIKTKRCVSTIEGQNKFVVRMVEVPVMEGKELEESMTWEIDRQVPFAATSQVEMDYAVLPAVEDAQTMDVLMAVAQTDVLESHAEALVAAGLKPYAIDLGPLAAERALVETDPTDPDSDEYQQVVAIISVGAKSTEMGIYEHGLLTFPCPAIEIAGDKFTEEISEALGIPLEEAEEIKRELAYIDIDAMGSFEVEGSEEATTYDPSYFASPESDFNTYDPEDFASSEQGYTTQDGMDDVYGDQDDAPAAPGSTFDLGLELGFMGADETPAAEEPQEQQEEEPVADAFDGFDLSGQTDIVPSAEEDEPEAEAAGWQLDYDLSDLDESLQDPHMSVASGMSDSEIASLVAQAISGAVSDLIADIRSSIEYYTVRYNSTPTKIYLSGGTAKIPNLVEYMTNELGIPVVIANPLENLKYQLPDMDETTIQDLAPMFSESIGLAIRDMVG